MIARNHRADHFATLKFIIHNKCSSTLLWHRERGMYPHNKLAQLLLKSGGGDSTLHFGFT
jgi:hypothetical protein